jgi:two-component system chemotaxis response regulator CheB
MTRVRVLIVDDSRVQRDLLRLVLGEDPGLDLVGEAHNGLEAIEAANRLHPDVITMDLQMPELGGIDAVERIMAEAPSRIIVVCALDNQHELDLSFRAIAAGALELIAKPRADGVEQLSAWGRSLRESIRLMAEVPVVRRWRRGAAPSLPTSTRPESLIDAVGIVASTGGPPAVASILAAMPKTLTVPVLIAQHIAPGFAAGLIRWLSGVTPLEVLIARPGMRLGPGRVYLPPDEHDLLVERGGFAAVRRVDALQCPSGDALLVSIASVFGSRGCGVVLTGMGNDGAQGVGKLVAHGAVALAQEASSCAVAGMPTQAIAAGAKSASLVEIAASIIRLAGPTHAP